MYFQQYLQRHPTSILQIVAARDRRREPTWRMKIPKSKIPIVSRHSFYVHRVPDRVLCIAKISRCFVIEKLSMQQRKKKRKKKKRKRYVILFAVFNYILIRSSLCTGKFHHLRKLRYIVYRTNSSILLKILFRFLATQESEISLFNISARV